MKLLTFEEQGVHKLGVRTAQGIVDVAATAEKVGNKDVKTDVMDVIASTREEVSNMNDVVERAVADDKAVFVNEESMTWGPSVTRPHKIICVGLNYAKHAD